MGTDSWTWHKSSVDKLCTTPQHQTSVMTGLIYVESQTDMANTISTLFCYSKTKQMRNISNLFYFRTTLHMFRMVSPSIISSLRLYIQHHTIQVLWLLASKQPQNLNGMMLYVQS